MKLPLFDISSINDGYFNTQRVCRVQGLMANMLNGQGSSEAATPNDLAFAN
jgi:hypothetical protein